MESCDDPCLLAEMVVWWEIEVLVSVGFFPVDGEFDSAILIPVDQRVKESNFRLMFQLSGKFDPRVLLIQM